MKIKFPKGSSHGLYSKEKHGKEKRWVPYNDDETIEIEIEVDTIKEKLYKTLTVFYDKDACLLFYVNEKNTTEHFLGSMTVLQTVIIQS